MRDQLKEKALRIFAHNTKIDEVHIIANGKAFHEKHVAESHAATLKDSKVYTFTREEVRGKEQAAKDAEYAKTLEPVQEEPNDGDTTPSEIEVKDAKEVKTEADGKTKSNTKNK